jgi:hypothetical protein
VLWVALYLEGIEVVKHERDHNVKGLRICVPMDGGGTKVLLAYTYGSLYKNALKALEKIGAEDMRTIITENHTIFGGDPKVNAKWFTDEDALDHDEETVENAIETYYERAYDPFEDE